MNGLRVVIVGADGFLGRRVQQELQAADWATPSVGDVRNRQQLAAALAGSDAVVNAASGAPGRVRAAADALYSLAEDLPSRPRIVHLSSMTVYGSLEGDVDETAELRADLGEYSQAHLQAERRAARCANSVVLRPGCEYGPRCPDWSERIARLLAARRIGDLGAAGDGYCNLIYVDDLAGAILRALRAPGIEQQAFNLAMPAPPTWNEYFAAFAQALGAVPLVRISKRRLELETKLLAPPLRVAQIAARAARLPGSLTPAVFSPSLARSCRQEIRLDSRKAQRLLGANFTALPVGLARAAASINGAAA